MFYDSPESNRAAARYVDALPSSPVRPFLVLLVLLLSLRPAQAQNVVVRAEVASQTVSPDGAVNYAVVVAGEGTALVPTPNAPSTVGLAAVDP